MEKRLAITTSNPELVLRDSWATLDESVRESMAILIIPGTTIKLWGKVPPTREALTQAVKEAANFAFHAVFVETPTHSCPEDG